MNARSGSGELDANFAAKGVEIPRTIALWRRQSVRWLAGGLAGAAVVIGGVMFVLGYQWRQAQLAELEAQRHCLQTFLGSEEFAQFARVADAQFVALNNFIATQPVA